MEAMFKAYKNPENNTVMFKNEGAFMSKPSSKKKIVVKYTNQEVKEYANLKALQSSAEFEEILDKVDDGKVFSIDYWVTAFTDTVNANFSRPKEGELQKIAEKYENDASPLLDDHLATVESEKGRVSALEFSDGKPKMLDALVSLRKKSAQDDYLRGMSGKYSSRFTFTDAECSICQKEYERYSSMWGTFSFPICNCKRGQKYNGKICEMLFWGCEYVELSRTPAPADGNSKPKSQSYSNGKDGIQELQELSEDEVIEMADKEKIAGTLADGIDFSAQIAEKDAKIKKLEEQNAAFAKIAETSHKTAMKFAVQILQDRRKIDAAEAQGEEVSAIFSSMGIEAGFAVINRWETKEDLSGEMKSKKVSAPEEKKAPESKTDAEFKKAEADSTFEYLKKNHPAMFPESK